MRLCIVFREGCSKGWLGVSFFEEGCSKRCGGASFFERGDQIDGFVHRFSRGVLKTMRSCIVFRQGFGDAFLEICRPFWRVLGGLGGVPRTFLEGLGGVWWGFWGGREPLGEARVPKLLNFGAPFGLNFGAHRGPLAGLGPKPAPGQPKG